MKKILSNKIAQLLIIVVIASVLSVVLNIVKTNEYKDWVSSDAVITNWETTKKDVKHIIYFKYYVDGNEYNGQDVFKGNYPENGVGDTVTVWYDPDNVSQVMRSDKKPNAGLWTYVPFIFAIPISIFVLSGGYRPRTRSLV